MLLWETALAWVWARTCTYYGRTRHVLGTHSHQTCIKKGRNVRWNKKFRKWFLCFFFPHKERTSTWHRLFSPPPLFPPIRNVLARDRRNAIKCASAIFWSSTHIKDVLARTSKKKKYFLLFFNQLFWHTTISIFSRSSIFPRAWDSLLREFDN